MINFVSYAEIDNYIKNGNSSSKIPQKGRFLDKLLHRRTQIAVIYVVYKNPCSQQQDA